MVTRKASKPSLERQIEALGRMLQTQQQQIEFLVEERLLFENRLQQQRDRWVSDVNLQENHIYQLRRKVLEAEKGRFHERAKAELLVALKRKKSLYHKLISEFAESDLRDFQLCFDYLAHKLSLQNEKSGDKHGKFDKGKGRKNETADEDEQCSRILEDELKELKHAFNSVTSSNKSEISALLLERDFVWNQFRNMESDCSNIRKNKKIEAQQASEKINKLLAGMEQLQSSKNEKDEIIVKLKADLASLEEKSNREISRLSKEVEVLRNSRGAPLTLVLNPCTTRAGTVSMETKKASRDRRPAPRKESPGSETSGLARKSAKMETRGSKRTEVEAKSNSDTPRLFTSRFKVPKLKDNSSPSTTS